MKISLIAAIDKNRLIGKDGIMPWHLPADLAHFKRKTLHKPIIMGRKTYESLGKPLPNRRNIVITRQKDLHIHDVEIFTSLEDALNHCKNEDEIMIIGGGEIFKQALPLANYMYITIIDAEFEGNIFFPQWDSQEWQTVKAESFEKNAENNYRFQIIEYQRQRH